MVHLDVKRTPENGGLIGAAERVRRNAPAFRVIATRIRRSTMKNFMVGGWYPEHWPTSRAASARGGKTLVHRATLKNSISAQGANNIARVGTSVKYAAVHQFGAVIEAKSSRGLRFRIGDRWITKHSVTIPARPFLPIRNGRLHPDDQRYIDSTLRNWIAHGIARPA